MERPGPSDPVSKAARGVVRGQLDAALSASARLSDPTDVEALHDCRVALRRLRVALKAYGPVLKPGVPKDLRKAVSILAGETGPARDAEVFIDWLASKLPRLLRSWQGPARKLGEKAVARRDALYRRLRRVIPKVLAMIEPLLRAGLSVGARPQGSEPTFGGFTARRVEEQIEELVAALEKVKGPEDDGRAHRARIAAKKVRYLLEPALGPRGSGVLKPLKHFQDRLGAFHDLGDVRAQLQRGLRSVRGSAGEARNPAAAFRGIAARAERERLLMFRQIKREFLGTKRPWLQPVIRWARRHGAKPPPAPAPGAASRPKK